MKNNKKEQTMKSFLYFKKMPGKKKGQAMSFKYKEGELNIKKMIDEVMRARGLRPVSE